MNLVSKKWQLVAVLGACFSALIGRADPPSRSFKVEGEELQFDTGVVSGGLKKNGKGPGLMPLAFLNPETAVAAGNGVFVPYRFLTTDRRYGFGSWEWDRTGRLRENGDAQLEWLGTADRPFAFSTIYHWRDSNTLDLTLIFGTHTSLHHFELFLASYFRNFTVAKAYVKDAGLGKAGFVEAGKDQGAWQYFPARMDMLPIITDGRWKYPPYPIEWTIRNGLEAPLGMRVEPTNGVTVLMMAPPEDCFAVAMPQEEAALGSFYLSFFGQDMKAGETRMAHARLVFGKNMTDAEAEERYATYLKELRPNRDEAIMSPGAREGMMARSVAAIAAELAARATWFSDAAPPVSVDGWTTLFDGKRIYGKAKPEDVAAGKTKVSGGALLLDGTTAPLNFSGGDVAIRARVKKVNGQNCGLMVRTGDGRLYEGLFNGGNSFGIGILTEGKWKGLGSVRAQRNYNDYFEMEFRAEGGTLQLLADGKEIYRVQEETFKDGGVAVTTYRGSALFESIEARQLK